MKTYNNNTNIINTYPSPTRLRNEHIAKVVREIRRELSGQSKQNLVIVSDYNLPKLNVIRNQRRLSSVFDSLLLYINTCTEHLTPDMIRFLSSLVLKLENLYHDDPAKFVGYSKLLANWLRVNLSRKLRQRDMIPSVKWDPVWMCPRELSDLFMEIYRFDDHDASRECIRLILSMLESYMVVTVPKLPSFDSITAPFSGVAGSVEAVNVKGAISELDIDLEQVRLDFVNANLSPVWHSSSAQGPNGQALWMAHIDARAIEADPTLKSNIAAFSELVDRPIMDQISDSHALPQFFKVHTPDAVHSKLHYIFEKGDKCRVIAIVDYFTQELLTPLHNTISDINHKIENDGTFDQDKIIAKVRQMTSDKSLSLHSLDLTAATDRLPVSLQARIIDHVLGIPGLGKAWQSLITDRDWLCPTGHKLRYAVGQPMGAKSSFPMLALTHHVIVMDAALKCGITGFKDYVLLGDDIVIANEEVASKYKSIMLSLGLELSQYKSIESSSETYSCAEICKRLFVDGQDWSPLPPKLLATVGENGDMMYQLQEVLGERDLLKSGPRFELFAAGVISERDFDFLAKLNGLPQTLTGMRHSFPFNSKQEYNSTKWATSIGVTARTLESFYTYTIVTEQLKRMGSILEATTDVYSTIIKAASVSKTTGIGSPETGYLPIEDFTREEAETWDTMEMFHPAINAVKGEVNRMNDILMQMVSSDIDTLNLLRGKVVDALKVTCYENIPDSEVRVAKATRKLLELCLRYIRRALKMEDKLLTYSVRLSALHISWNVRVSVDGPCILSRSTKRISTYQTEAQMRLRKYESSSISRDALDVLS